MAKAPKKAAKPAAATAANMGAGADEQNAAQPAKAAAPSHGDRLDKLEADHAALLDIVRANGWSLPE